MDLDGDGQPELITAIHHDPYWFDPNAPDISSVFGGWPACTDDPACPLLDLSCMQDGYECDRHECGITADTINLCMSTGEDVPCGAMFFPWDPDCDHDCSEEYECNNGCVGSGPKCMENRLPHQICDRYPWMIHWNEGDGLLASELVIRLAPIPLESEGGDSNVGPGRYSSASHTFTDIDGDGLVDAVMVPKVVTWDPAIEVPPNWWYVFRGDGRGGFHPSDSGHPYVWNVPPHVRPSWSDGYSPSDEVKLSATAGALIDMNADGLPDLVTRVRHDQDSLDDPYLTGEEVKVYYNTGRGFRTGPWTNMSQHARFLPADVAYPAAGRVAIHEKWEDWIQYAERHEVVRTLDVDADGRVDFFVQDPHCASGTCSRRLLSNAGDGLGPAHAVPNDKLHEGLRRLVYADGDLPGSGEWRLARDLLDIDGDGQLDYVDTIGQDVKVWSDDYQGMPPRLLHRIENGRGGHVNIRYARTGDAAIDADPATDNGIPSSQWAVSSVSVGDPFGSPAMTTTYAYEAPVWSTNPHTRAHGFRGFERVHTRTPAGAVIEERYGYDDESAGFDWSGRLTGTVTYRDSSLSAVASISETEWQKLTLFNAQVVSYQPQIERTYTCRLQRSEAACRADGLIRRTDTDWVREWPIVSSGAGPALWVAASSRVSAGNSDALLEGDRLDTTEFHLFHSSSLYRLRTARRTRYEQDGGLVEVARSEHVWQSDGLWERRTITWRSPTQKSISERGVDSVGNVVWEKRPNQVTLDLDGDPDTAGAAASFSYDAARVHVRKHANELGHIRTTHVDLGTGATLRTLGPNSKTVTKERYVCSWWYCYLQEVDYTYFVEWRSDVDGFGRTLTSYVSVDAGENAGFTLEPVERISRDDHAFAGGGMTSVETVSYIDIGDVTTAAVETRFYDGHHRLVQTRAVTSEGPDAVSTYSYDAGGQLASLTVPSPVTDGQVETYSYLYDSLGQVTQVLRPDGAGRSFVYDGLRAVRADLVTDDGPAPRVELTRDVFGRLREVRERIGTGATIAMTDLPAVYEYDANDNLRRMVDADGVITDLEHDWVGNRTSITREGQRSWQYHYDDDSNQVLRLAPRPVDANVLDYSTEITYDALGRPRSKRAGVAGMTTADVALLGADGWIEYTYDDGPYGIGQLSAVQTLTGTGARLTEQRFAHDPLGNVIEQGLSFDLTPIGYPGLAETRGLHHEFNAAGQPTDVWYGDSPWKDYSTHVEFLYDVRGNLDVSMRHFVYGAPQTLADNIRNVAGLVTDLSLNSGSASASWSYDSLGRVIHQQVDAVNAGGLVAVQSFDLHDSGDPRVLVNELAGTQQTYAFQHDHQRQLVHAEGTDGFDQTLSYLQSGRLDSNVVSPPSTAGHTVTARDVIYEYGNQAESHQVTSLIDETGGRLARYSYDPAGNITTRDGLAIATSEHVYDGLEDQRVVRRAGAEELYFYDGGRQRLLALDTTGGRLRLFHGPLEVHYDLGGTVERTWAHVSHGSTTIRVENRGTAEWTIHSALRHALVTLDSNGALVAGFNYAPFGELLATLGNTEARPRRFNDKIHDESSGLAYYGYRYYDPLSLIWMQADPLYRFAPDFAGEEPRRASLYTFSLNSPLSMLDPDGRCPKAGASSGPVDCADKNNSRVDAAEREAHSRWAANRPRDDFRMLMLEGAAAGFDGAGDVVVGVVYAAQGDFENAAWSAVAAIIPFLPAAILTKTDEVVEVGGKLVKGDKAPTSRAARREAMRRNNTPTSRPVTSQSGPSGRRQTVVDGPDGRPQVQTQHPPDGQHPDPHWHDSKPKVDQDGKLRTNSHGQIKDWNEGRSTVTYPQ